MEKNKDKNLTDIINDPTIPNNDNIIENNYNKNTIQYLDTDLYNTKYTTHYIDNDTKIKIYSYIFVSILGIVITIRFFLKTKSNWNIMILFILLIFIIRYFLDTVFNLI